MPLALCNQNARQIVYTCTRTENCTLKQRNCTHFPRFCQLMVFRIPDIMNTERKRTTNALNETEASIPSIVGLSDFVKW